MPTDIGFWMVMAAFVAALAAFGFGWGTGLAMRRHRRRSGEPPPPPAAEGRGVWRIPSSFYGPIDLPVMGLLVLVYTLPMWSDLFGWSEDRAISIGPADVIATIALQLLMTAMVIGFVAWRKRPVDWLGLRWRYWPLAIPIAMGVVGLSMVLMWLLQVTGYLKWLERAQGHDGLQDAVKAFGEAEDVGMLTLLSVTAVLVAPVTEEVLFRGYLYPAAKRFVGRGSAVIFSALIFSIAHNNALALLPLFFLAVLLILVYEWTGSLWTPIAAHVLFNGMTVTAQLLARAGALPALAP